MELHDYFFKDAERVYNEWLQNIENGITRILRNYIKDPIKGDITKEELDKRNIGKKYFEGLNFLGIEEDGVLIHPNGCKTILPRYDVHVFNCATNDSLIDNNGIAYAYWSEKHSAWIMHKRYANDEVIDTYHPFRSKREAAEANMSVNRRYYGNKN